MEKKPNPRESALALIDYPSRFPLKVLGSNTPEFEDIVLALVRARCPQAEHIESSKRDSRNGKYLSLTLTFTVQNQQQLEEIYADLYRCEHVMMSL
ncbi:MAG: putative lipoic acid-binding regulatory protein [Planctomycetota bacterium]|jgi:putative lipoic acid-binding regulatory protein